MSGLALCSECGMPVETNEYHPYAACLMFKACGNSVVVRMNLDAVVTRATAAPACEHDMQEGYGVPAYCHKCGYTAAPVVVGDDVPWADDETRLTVTLKQLMKDRPLYLMGREHVEQKTKPLAEIQFGMTTELGVLFCMKDTEAPIPVDPAMTAALSGEG